MNGRILILDNYDSFTENLLHLVETIAQGKVDVFQNDRIDIKEAKKYEKILLSPGPGIPSESGILLELIRNLAAEKSILGICLGHQAIAEVFGAQLLNLERLYHGEQTAVHLLEPENPLFQGYPEWILAGRYHSWVVSKNNLPSTLNITAEDESGLIMGLRHQEYDVQGVQFHPESFLTENGAQLIHNWLSTY